MHACAEYKELLLHNLCIACRPFACSVSLIIHVCIIHVTIVLVDLCNNIGSLVYLLSGAMSLHHLVIMTKPSLSCLLCFLRMLAIPIFPFLKFEEFLNTYIIYIANRRRVHQVGARSRSPQLMLCDAMRCDAMRCDAMRCDAMRCDAMRCDAMLCCAMLC